MPSSLQKEVFQFGKKGHKCQRSVLGGETGGKSSPYPVAKIQDLSLRSSATGEAASDKKGVLIRLHKNLGDVSSLSRCSLHQGTVLREEPSDYQNG